MLATVSGPDRWVSQEVAGVPFAASSGTQHPRRRLPAFFESEGMIATETERNTFGLPAFSP